MNARHIHVVRDPRSGLTLVELLVVLFILALLAQTAVLATEGIVDQGQRDATVRSLAAFEEAVLGAPDRIDSTGRPLVRGFVADTGRLPVRSASADAGTFLEELWNRPATIEPFRYVSPAGDQTVLPGGERQVRIGCGWRGNYLRLGIGRTTLLDGWGRPFTCGTADGTPLDAGEPIATLESLGANALAGGTGYDEDLAVRIEHSVAPVVAPRWQGSVPVFIASAAGGSFVVRIYGPHGSDAVTLAQVPDTGVTLSVPAGGATITIDGVSIGPRVLRVYAGTPPDDGWNSPLGAPCSAAMPIVVEPRGIPAITVEMP